MNWCLPPFGNGNHNFTCSWLATNGNMYFVNHTAERWEDNQCCTFEKVCSQLCTEMFPVLWLIVFQGLGAVTPDWVKNAQYNGTTFL